MTFSKHFSPLLLLLIFFLVVLAASPSIFFYQKYKEMEKKLERNPLILESNVQSIVGRVGKLIELPSDELPTVAVVSDIEKLKNQPFFAKAKNGDNVLIYNTAKKAILFDPSANKIIEMGPLGSFAQTPSSSPAQQIAQTQPIATAAGVFADQTSLRVMLLNGTKTAGLTQTVASQLTESALPLTIVSKDTAQKLDYQKTLVIDLTGTVRDDAERIADFLHAELSSLPAGEEKPLNADILIIVGEDKT